MTVTCCPGNSMSFWWGFAPDTTVICTANWSWHPHQPASVVKKTKPQSMFHKDAPFISYKRCVACQHSPDDQTLSLQAGAGEDDFIHLPSGPDRVACERQEEEEETTGMPRPDKGGGEGGGGGGAVPVSFANTTLRLDHFHQQHQPQSAPTNTQATTSTTSACGQPPSKKQNKTNKKKTNKQTNKNYYTWSGVISSSTSVYNAYNFASWIIFFNSFFIHSNYDTEIWVTFISSNYFTGVRDVCIYSMYYTVIG